MAVMLIGTATMGVLPLLYASVHGSALQDRFAGARRWLVSAGDYTASDKLARMSCATNTTGTIITTYQNALRTAVAGNRPAGPWTDSQLTVTGVLFWNGTTFTSTCTELTQPALQMQQISLRVVTPGSAVVETLDVVKDVPSSV